MPRAPELGDVVHYVSHGSADGTYPRTCRAAIVTDSDGSGCVGLAVLNPQGLFFDQAVVPDPDERLGGTWHWPIEC